VEYFIKNPPKWPKEEFISELNIFKELYKKRPIEKNLHGIIKKSDIATKPIFNDVNTNFGVSKNKLNNYNHITYIKLK
jgi:hypothetical protein